MSSSGLVPTPPAVLRARLLALVGATSPGYTANLPGSLIEDLSSTSVGALITTDSAKVETVDSISPYGANPWVLNNLGQVYGVPIGGTSNTSVLLTFSGTVGFFIPAGFIVTDGTYQYIVQDGGAVAAGGSTAPLFAVSPTQGAWAVPANSVSHLSTSVPATITLTVTNALPGIPGTTSGESEDSYRAALLTAGLAASQGMTRYLKTLLGNVSGVQRRLISARQVGTAWEIIVGGGDPYAVASAIFRSVFYLPGLIGSSIGVTGITNAALGVVTTNLNHGLTDGQANVFLTGVLGMTAANGGPYTVHVLTPTTFTFGVDTSGFGVYTSGGAVTPNTRNVVVSVKDYPDTYAIPFVVPPQQTILIAALWNTAATNLVNPAAVSQLAIPAIVNYINSVAVGQPINVLEMNEAFSAAIASILPPDQLTRLVFTVTINGVVTAPNVGTLTIFGDPESFFFATAANVTVNQG